VAAEIAAAEPRIDVLINNAGAMFGRRRVTADGLELTFATNHMSYFLTHGLRERLLASAPARVVNTSSAAHRRASLDFDTSTPAWRSAARRRGRARFASREVPRCRSGDRARSSGARRGR